MADTDDELPESVQAEVDKIKAEGQADLPEPETEVPMEKVKLSRRQVKDEEMLARATAAEERAAKIEEASLARERASEERLARMEGMLAGQMQQRREPEPRDRTVADDDEESPQQKYNAAVKEAKAILVNQDIDGYHEKMAEANRILIRAEAQKLMRKQQQSAPQSADAGKPEWMRNVEIRNYDVLMHPEGQRIVTGFAHLEGFPAQPTPDKLERAFAAARQYLAPKKKDESPTDNEKKRQQLAGTGGGGNGGGGARRGGGERHVNLPVNYKDKAKQAGMTAEQYAKAYAQMNPGAVTDD